MGLTSADPRTIQILDYLNSGVFPPEFPGGGIRKGRSPRDGYARGWGLAATYLSNRIEVDPVYRRCWMLAEGRTIQDPHKRMNLYLIIRYYLSKLGSGSIVEFGSWHGGSAIFMAALCKELELPIMVYGLDTFKGIPSADPSIDAHVAGDFAGPNLNDLRKYVHNKDLEGYLVFHEGVFVKTAPVLLKNAHPILLTHIDCDTYDSVAYAYDAVKPHMAKGGYIVFDDATTPSCLGNTEAVEELVVRRDGLHSEQMWPHAVFRSGL